MPGVSVANSGEQKFQSFATVLFIAANSPKQSYCSKKQITRELAIH